MRIRTALATTAVALVCVFAGSGTALADNGMDWNPSAVAMLGGGSAVTAAPWQTCGPAKVFGGGNTDGDTATDLGKCESTTVAVPDQPDPGATDDTLVRPDGAGGWTLGR
ncbi:hypothetical protein [Streptomyces clavifer]|uniref:hypothetical protein n=1 Tax=Streptomyces clavifer TaxID=68188 RepID=UPI00381A03CF